jgi:RimJ/RimL family protein N-acetyltransferase
MLPEYADTLRLVEMDETPFREHRKHLVRDYAADKVRSGVWSEAEAEDRAAKEVDGLLPEGPATPDHFLYSVRDESIPAEVGMLWVSLRDSGRSLWIYDIIVHERFRRRGYATRILDLVEGKARELGAGKVELHVFGHNHGARALYEKMGYRPTSVIMAKLVSTEHPEANKPPH